MNAGADCEYLNNSDHKKFTEVKVIYLRVENVGIIPSLIKMGFPRNLKLLEVTKKN